MVKSRVMNVWFIVNRYPPHVGGLEFHVQHLASELSARGHHVTVVSLDDVPGKRRDGDVSVKVHRGFFDIGDVISFPAPREPYRLKKMLVRHQVDVVSTHTRFFPMSAIGLRAAHSAGVPVLHTEHGSGFVVSDSRTIAWGSRAVDLTAGRHVLRGADKVLAISDAAAKFVYRLARVEADVFPNAVMPAMFRSPEIDRPEHLVFVGRIVPGKGWDTYLRTVFALRQSGLEVDGEMLGGGPQLEQAAAMAYDLGLDGVVAIRGRVPQTEVRSSLAGATLLNPTVLSEGFQTTLIEAAIEGGRVVTYDVPGIQQLRASGAPISVAESRSEDEFIELVRTAVDKPLPIAPCDAMEGWTWPVRASEYERILEGVVSAPK